MVTGEMEIRSSNLSFNMLAFNARARYKNDPSPANLEKIVGQAHDFFAKFEVLLHSEIASLVTQGNCHAADPGRS
jgi:hypothetical protein